MVWIPGTLKSAMGIEIAYLWKTSQMDQAPQHWTVINSDLFKISIIDDDY